MNVVVKVYLSVVVAVAQYERVERRVANTHSCNIHHGHISARNGSEDNMVESQGRTSSRTRPRPMPQNFVLEVSPSLIYSTAILPLPGIF